MSDLNQLDQVLTKILEDAWDVFWRDVLVYVLASLLCAVLVVGSAGILSGVMAVGFALLVQSRRSGADVGAFAVFGGLTHLVGATLASLVIAVGVAVGMIFLILPGLLLAAAWSFTFVAMAKENLGAGEALSRSYSIFQEHALLVIALLVVLFILNMLGMAVVVGQVVTIPLRAVAIVVAYDELAQTPLRPQAVDPLRPHGLPS
jgi:hypothetical protein